MLMSQSAMSAGATGCPNCTTCAVAAAGAARRIAAQKAKRSSIDIACLPFFIDAPACDRVVVIGAAQAAFGREGGAAGLHHPGVVGRAALQYGRAPVPLPGCAKAHRRFRQD